MSDDLSNCIAVVGLSVRVPGASDAEAFWTNLAEGRETIHRFTDDELLAAGVSPEQLAEPSYVKARGVLDGYDLFDAQLFDIPPREADLMDPQHRILLEACQDALDDSGYGTGTAAHRTDVYAGCGFNGYLQHVIGPRSQALDPLDEYKLSIGNEASFPATRVAYKLDLRGAAVNLDTACSTGLVAVHMACQSLLVGQCDMAVAGAVTVLVPHHTGYRHHKGGILSADGACRPFDAAGSGFVEGSGCGVVVLRRLEDALRDGDPVRAVLLGSAINNDGSAKIGFSAPSVGAQGEVIAEALSIAGVEADDLDYVEAHGTATTLGDPVEAAALLAAVSTRTSERPLRIGSVKSNLGHLGAAAGIVGLIKVVLSLEHDAIPPSLHFETPNPEVDFGAGLQVNVDRTQWPRLGGPRVAGVTSLGMGGTNAHVVVGDAPAGAVSDGEPARSAVVPQLLLVSGATPPALESVQSQLADHLATTDNDLADVAHTLANGRRHRRHRAFAVGSGHNELSVRLRSAPAVELPQASPSVAFLFPGQGAQRPAMGSALYRSSPVFREAFDCCTSVAARELGVDVRSEIDRSGPDNRLDETWLTQPAMFAVSYSLAVTLESAGIRADLMVGHSIGELVSAVLSGVMSVEDGMRVICTRGRLMQDQPSGRMVVVHAAAADVAADLPAAVSVAVDTGPRQCVVSGPERDVAVVESRWAHAGVRCVSVRTTRAFHSAMMDPCLEPLTAAFAAADLSEPGRPFVSTATGELARPDQVVEPDFWAAQARQPVRLTEALATAVLSGATILLEVGPGRSLSSAAALLDLPAGVSTIPVLSGDGDEMEQVLVALGRLWQHGVEVEPDVVTGAAPRRRVRLPGYPFQRRRHWWTDSAGGSAPSAQRAAGGVGQAVPETAAPDAEHVSVAVLDVLSDVSGLAPAEIDMDRSLLAQGFDSVLLLHVSHRLSRRFGTEVGLARLFEELQRPADLVAHFAELGTAIGVAQEPGPAVERLDVDRVVPVTDGTGPGDPESPFRPATVPAVAVPLDDEQRRFVDSYVDDYVRRTAGSRSYVQEHRRWHADSRDSVAFAREWKQLAYPLVAQRSEGAQFWDVDGNRYVDLAMGFGVHLFGHRPAFVEEAIRDQLARGLHLGPQSDLAGEVARLLCELTGNERAAFCNSGTEAVMTALRLARARTGRGVVAMFRGSYHGTFDGTLGRATPGQPGIAQIGPPGTTRGMVQDTLVLEFGSAEALETLRAWGDQLAAVLVEPVPSRRPDLQLPEFLASLRELTRDVGAALVFDEIITGFRTSPGGAQEHFGIGADLVTYGKVLGGGMPIGVVAGSAAYVDQIDGGFWSFEDDSGPSVPQTFFAGTFCKHPLAMAATRATLQHLQAQGPHLQAELNRRSADLVCRIASSAAAEGLPLKVTSFASLFVIEIEDPLPTSALFYAGLVLRGVYVWEGRTCFLSPAHSTEDEDLVVSSVLDTARELHNRGLLTSRVPTTHLAGPSRRLPSRQTPLTTAQQQLWIASQVMEPSTYNERLLLRVIPALDASRLRTALTTLAERHEALRAEFAPDGSVVTIRDHVDVPVEVSQVGTEAAARATLELFVSAPFDLQQAPLWRVAVCDAGEASYVGIALHHLVTDGWSTGVLLDELSQLYADPGHRLPPAASLLDLAERLGEAREPDSRFWAERFPVGLPSLVLPTDEPAGMRVPNDPCEVRSVVPASVWQAVASTARNEGSTLLMTTLVALQALLSDISGNPVVTVALHGAGQALLRDPLVAYGVNILPVCTTVESGARWRDLLDRARTEVSGAFEHQSVPFGGRPGRGFADRVPVAFNFERADGEVGFAGHEVQGVPLPTTSSRWPLSVNCAPDGDEVHILWAYDPLRFRNETVEEWAVNYGILLSRVADPDSSVGDAIAWMYATRNAAGVGPARGRRALGATAGSILGGAS